MESPLQNQKRECKNINGKLAQLKIAKRHTNKYLFKTAKIYVFSDKL